MPEPVKNRFPSVWVWLAAALLILVPVSGLHPVGLADPATDPSPAGFSDRPLIVCKKIGPSPALSAAAGSHVVSKKIEPLSAALKDAPASPGATAPARAGDPAPAAPTDVARTAADEWPLTAVFLHVLDRWRDTDLGGTPGLGAGATEPDFMASAKGDDAALSSDSPAGESPVVNALLTGNDFSGIPAAAAAATQTNGAAPAAETPPRTEPAPAARLSSVAAGTPDAPRLLPYSLQLSSCRSLKNARNAAADFRKKGLEPYLVNVNLRSRPGSWWRVMCGQYPSVEAARRARESLQLTQAIVKRTRFANLIGDYPDKDALLEVKNRLEAGGVSAYTVEDAAAGFRLYVGAFTRRHQAAEQAIDLRAGGLTCRVVLR